MIDIFQSDEYYSFLEGTGFLEPFRFCVYRSDREVGRIQGFIQKDGGPLKRFLSRRAIINGGPWFAGDITKDEVDSLLRNCVEGLVGKVIYIETRNFKNYARFRLLFEKTGFCYEPHYDFVIVTESVPDVDAIVGKSRKRDAKASIRNGAMVIENPTPEEVHAFYDILADLYEKKVKTPLFNRDFFLKLYRSQFCKYILIGYDNQVIGGSVCVFDDESVYEWFVCGKDGIFKNVHPSTLATYSAIQFAVERGYKRFDMMGAGSPGDGGYGVREFKAKFGGDLVEYGRFKYVCKPFLYAMGKIGVKLMKRKS